MILRPHSPTGLGTIIAVPARPSPFNSRQIDRRFPRFFSRREIEAIVVWKLDRWGRSLPDLIATLAELRDLDIAFISLTEALDFTTPAGRAMIALLSVFAEFERDMIRERVKAGITQARAEGRPHGRPKTASLKAAQIKKLYKKGWNKSRIARELKISRGSVIALLK